MRQFALALAVLAAGTVAMPTRAHDMHLHASCSIETDYDIDVQHNGILFSRTDATPHTVRMHDGTLQVDGHALAVSQADAARLRQYEAQWRALLPEAAGMAREGVGIGFDALTTVAASFAEQPDERSEVIHQLMAQRQRVLAQIDQGIGSGHWRQQRLDQLTDEGMSDAVSTLVSTVAARAVKAELSGDQGQVAALEARADSLNKSIDRAIEVPARRLSERADALCPRLVALDQLQQQLSLRLPDGSALSLMTVGEKAAARGGRRHTGSLTRSAAAPGSGSLPRRCGNGCLPGRAWVARSWQGHRAGGRHLLAAHRDQAGDLAQHGGLPLARRRHTCLQAGPAVCCATGRCADIATGTVLRDANG